MIVTILILSLMYAYLLWELNWLRIRLPVGAIKPPKYARYIAYNVLGNHRPMHLYQGDNYPKGYVRNGEPEYSIFLSPGIHEPMCGWKWLDAHVADMVDYKPEVYMVIGNVRYTMTIKEPSIIKDIMRVNKLTRAQKQALA